MADNLSKAEGLEVSSQDVIDEKTTAAISTSEDKSDITKDEINGETDRDSAEVIIVTGADAAQHLLPLRDDFEPTVTFRSILLASLLACFQGVMNQIYMVCSMPDDCSESMKKIVQLSSCTVELTVVNSSNRPRSRFKELSLFLSHTLLEMHGQGFFLAAISSRLVGYKMGAKANFRFILRSSSSSTQGNGL